MGPGVDTPLIGVEIRHLGGALAREASGAGAQAKIDAKYLVFSGGLSPSPELAGSVSAAANAVKDAVGEWHARYDYDNFVETAAGADIVLPAASYQRLRKIKAEYDPDQAIISVHPVPPAER